MKPERHIMEIDPDAPGLIEIWNGARGPAWQWGVRIAVLLLIFLNTWALLVVANVL